ncbi:phage regulatory CII family protein [Rhodovibrionaceae bacterium A322]
MSGQERDFNDLIYSLLVVEKSPSVEETAKAMGMSYDMLYARIRDRVPFRAHEIRALIAAVGDKRLADYFLTDSAYIAVDRSMPDSDGSVEGDVYQGAARYVLQAASVLRAVDDGLADQHIDHRERLAIEQEIHEAERALAALRARLAKD